MKSEHLQLSTTQAANSFNINVKYSILSPVLDEISKFSEKIQKAFGWGKNYDMLAFHNTVEFVVTSPPGTAEIKSEEIQSWKLITFLPACQEQINV